MEVLRIIMIRQTFIKLLFLPLLFAVIASCSTLGDDGPDGYILRRSDKPKATVPEEPKPKSSTETVTSETIGGTAGPVRQSLAGSGPAAPRSTGSGVIFTGAVTGIDTARRTISLLSTGKNLTFDLTNPVIRGYKDINEIKTGDTVTVGYIKGGIGIVKGENFHDDLKQLAAPDEPVPLKLKKGSKSGNARQSNRAAPVKVKYKVNSFAFKNVDNNKDGRVSPVELSNVIPNVTMEEFKKYDRNSDGGIDESEYRSVRKR